MNSRGSAEGRPALELTQVTDPSWTAGAPPKAARPWSSTPVGSS